MKVQAIMKKSFVVLCFLCALRGSTSIAAEKRPMVIDDLFHFRRVADPQISPDGSQVAYVVTTITDPAKNKTKSNLWLASTGKNALLRQFTTTDKRDAHPRWSPDGTRILFESNRTGGESQLWVIDVAGGEARLLTHISTGAGNAIWSRDGSRIAFVSAVFPENSNKPFAESDKLNKDRLEAEEKSPVKVRTANHLFWRHWDSYVEGKRQHLFVMNADGSDVRDVTPGARDAFPTSDTFATGDNFTFSPDGAFLIFTAVPARNEAWSTNYDICRVSIDNKSQDWQSLTKDNLAADNAPAFSPDGTKLAYRAQKKPGYEADKWELMVVAVDPSGAFTGTPASVSADLAGKPDIVVDDFVWVDEGRIVFAADERANKPLFLIWPGDSGHSIVSWGMKGAVTGLSASPAGKKIAFAIAQVDRPAEVFVTDSDLRSSAAKDISYANDELFSRLKLQRPESVEVPIEGGKMQMWLLKPPDFDPSKKWPVAYLVHGGPQGAWEDGWSYRWCPELWAAQGYVVALPNPRGSTGFGQKFVEEITDNWGGKCYDDLMKGADYVAGLPYVDKDRMIAAGASFGGYMVNWFAVNTGRFKALVTHCGVYNFDSMYGTTDEVWFDEYEHAGPPWGGNRASYEKFSPHRFAANLGKFKTPMLVIQNDLDFRCPVGQGIELFTALQRQGVPSRFVNFPDEGHWVLKPANSKRWHEEVFGWIKKHCPSGGQ
jgi:dipeptidyl aminopeptidase/acylaminoacyl peptidase